MFAGSGQSGRNALAASCGLFLLAANPALAQTVPAPSNTISAAKEDPFALERIVVTGSAIPMAVAESFAPVAVYSHEQLILSGANTPIEGLRDLPSFVGGAATEQDSNRGTGAANINLRGLGSTSTITLINGRRTAQAFNNINLIPLEAIKRIDVLKDGAAANYGADAIAGVVNFNLLEVPKGTQLRLTYGNTWDKDAAVVQGGIVTGVANDKTSFLLVANVYSRNDLYSRDRDVSKNADVRAFGGNNGGSDSFSGRLDTKGTTATGAPFGVPSQTNLPSAGYLRDGVAFPRSIADYRQYNVDTDRYNFRVLSPAVPGQQRASYYGVAKHAFLKNLTGKVDFLYSKLKTDNQLASSPITIAAAENLQNSPYLEIFETQTAIAAARAANSTTPLQVVSFPRYRTTEIGNRRAFWTEEAYRVFAGFEGDLARWHFDTGYMFAEMDRIRGDSGFPSRQKLRDEIASGAFNPFARNFATGIWTSPNTGRTFTFDNAAALQRTVVQDKRNTKRGIELVDFKISGPLFALPAGDLQAAAGVEHRTEYDDDLYGPLYNSGDALGLNTGNSFRGDRKVNAGYLETILPLIKNVAFAHDLSVNGAMRREDFEYTNPAVAQKSKFASTDWKAGLRWQPIDEITVRGTRSTAFRAPLESELYRATGTSNPTVNDPARKPDGSRFTPPGVQTRIQIGGNINLSPETADTWTAGIAWSPRALKGLFVSIDYYHVEKRDIIVVGDAQFILNSNWAGQGSGFPRQQNGVWQFDPGAPLANVILRQPDGSLSSSTAVISVIGTNLNLASNQVAGIDYTIGYTLPLGEGKLTTTLSLNQFLQWDLQRVTGAPTEDFVGHFVDISSDAFAPGSIPEWKGNVVFDYKVGKKWQTAFTINWIDSFQDDPNFVNPAFNGGTFFRRVKAWRTYDIIAHYALTERWLGGWCKQTRLTVGVENIGNIGAPLALGAFNDSYDTTLHSARGRFMHVSVTKRF
jgi:iron complex outermembrane recepter protein